MKKETKKLTLSIQERQGLKEITGFLPSTTFDIIEEMMDFRKSLEIAGSQEPETKTFELSPKLVQVIHVGMQRLEGVYPTELNLQLWKKIEKLNG